MATLKFILRKSRRGDTYAGKVCARLIHGRRVRVLTLEVSLYPGEWDAARQQVLPGEYGCPRHRYLQAASETLAGYRRRFDGEVSRLERQGRYTLEDLLPSYHSRRGISGLLGFTAYLSHGLERSGQERTARAYRSACRALVAFNKGCDIPLSHINSCLIKTFESYLKERGRAMNTISYYMRMLRAIYRRAVREGLIDAKGENPFSGVFTGFNRTRKRALDIGQLRKLNALDFSALLEQQADTSEPEGVFSGEKTVDKGLYESWRYFFFCFHARGMSFVDMAYLRKDNILHGVISYYRKKTGQKIEVTVTPTLERIIDSFHEEVKYSPYLFPVIHDPGKPARVQYESGLNTLNRRLKKLARMADIDLEWGLSTHVSRHSWATTGKEQNLPLSVISEGLGHATEKMTYTYLASFDRSRLDKANAKIARAIAVPRGVPSYSYAGL